MEADPFFKLFYLECQVMDKGNNSECYAPWSEPFGIGLGRICFSLPPHSHVQKMNTKKKLKSGVDANECVICPWRMVTKM
jgi:hypothetical protein